MQDDGVATLTHTVGMHSANGRWAVWTCFGYLCLASCMHLDRRHSWLMDDELWVHTVGMHTCWPAAVREESPKLCVACRLIFTVIFTPVPLKHRSTLQLSSAKATKHTLPVLGPSAARLVSQ